MSERHRQAAAYKLVREKLWSPKFVKRTERDQRIVVRRVVKRILPLWQFEATSFDSHVMRWRQHQFELKANPGAIYVRQRCLELDADYDDVFNSALRKHVQQRQQIMWEMVRILGWSLPRVGRFFGGFDHTTVLHAVRKFDAMKEPS